MLSETNNPLSSSLGTMPLDLKTQCVLAFSAFAVTGLAIHQLISNRIQPVEKSVAIAALSSVTLNVFLFKKLEIDANPPALNIICLIGAIGIVSRHVYRNVQNLYPEDQRMIYTRPRMKTSVRP